jgi:hypothetical protein
MIHSFSNSITMLHVFKWSHPFWVGVYLSNFDLWFCADFMVVGIQKVHQSWFLDGSIIAFGCEITDLSMTKDQLSLKGTQTPSFLNSSYDATVGCITVKKSKNCLEAEYSRLFWNTFLYIFGGIFYFLLTIN